MTSLVLQQICMRTTLGKYCESVKHVMGEGPNAVIDEAAASLGYALKDEQKKGADCGKPQYLQLLMYCKPLSAFLQTSSPQTGRDARFQVS